MTEKGTKSGKAKRTKGKVAPRSKEPAGAGRAESPDDTGASAASAEQGRLDQIKESHAFLRQFTPKELKVLMSLKRNTSPKAWSLREDLVVLSVSKSNREIAEILQDRNKEAVKKRLQLLRSKGLAKRSKESK